MYSQPQPRRQGALLVILLFAGLTVALWAFLPSDWSYLPTPVPCVESNFSSPEGGAIASPAESKGGGSISLPAQDSGGDGHLNSSEPLPRVLHFAYADPSTGAKPLSFVKWLSMTSAVMQLRPKRILMHTEVGRLPFGYWWERFFDTHQRLIQVVEHDPVNSVYGHPVRVLAHKTDVLRLDGIYNHGGVYLDSDVLVFRDFLPSLNDHLRQHPEQDAVLAEERDGKESYGNAVIMARPFSHYIALWKRGYHDFNDGLWSQHSTAYPRILDQQHPGLLHRLPNTAFYVPDWGEGDLSTQLFLAEEEPTDAPHFDFEKAQALGWHWWGHIVEQNLGDYTPCTVRAQGNRTVISRLVGHYVTEELCQHYRTAHKQL